MISQLIGFVGLRRAGKDTAAEALALAGFVNLKFADALKEMLKRYLSYVGVDDAISHRMIEGDLKETAAPVFCGKTTRWAMQTLGTEWGRNLVDSDIWVNACMSRAKGFSRVTVSDVRFPNEVAAIHSAGGKIIRIDRPGLSVDSHPSEQLIGSLIYDDVIQNDSTLETFATRVRAVAGV